MNRLTGRLLRWGLGELDARVFLSELEELYVHKVETDGEAAANRWMRRETRQAGLRAVAARLRSTPRPARPRGRSIPGGRMLLMQSVLQDMRYAARTLRRRPAFAAISILTLGLGIGSTTAIFSAVNSTLLRPLPFEEPERLMRVSLLLPRSVGTNPDGTRLQMVWSYPKYQLFRESQSVFDDVSTYFREQYNLTGGDQPERLQGEVVGTSYFSVLGIHPELGRGFTPEGDVTPGADHEVVLSHGLWVRRFGADPEILGSTIHLNGTPHTVVGVMPSGFSGLKGAPEVWVPTSTVRSRVLRSQSHRFHVVARLKSGFTYEQAIVAMRLLGEQVDEVFPDPHASGSWSATARPLDEYRVSKTMRTSVLILFGAAGLVLLTACVNVAGLVLGRSVTRRREIATRLAVGSSRQRLIRQLLTENLILAVLGGITGVAFALVGVMYFNSLGAAIRFNMSGLERTAFSSIHIDVTTLLFCTAIVTVTPLLVGLLPAFSSSRLSLADAIKGGASAGTPHRARTRVALVIAQVAIAFTLLVGSGLLIRTMSRLTATELGFQPATMLTVRFELPTSLYDRPARQAFFAQLLERVRALPGVQGATFTDCVPFADGCRNIGGVLSRGGRDTEPSAVGLNFVTPEYFDVLRVPVLGGRVFTTLDRQGSPRVVVISRATARRFWPGEDAVGKSLSLLGFEGATVIGVVGDVRYDNIEEPARPNVYISSLQLPRREGFVLARISGEPAPHLSAIREIVRGMDSNLPMFDIRTMHGRVDDEIWRTRFSTLLISLFASMTLLLSAIGIYGVLSYSVERKAHDIGVMMALGATRADVLKGVVGRALLMATAGIALGIIVALTATRVLAALLYETSLHDPLIFGAVVLVFITVALSASYFPARRASRLNPVDALQAE